METPRDAVSQQYARARAALARLAADPAGALCYRNAAMRDLVTFSAPVVFHGGAEPTVGIYGIEGSKPGAAVAAVYLSHRVIRPTKSGYGKIIGEALFSCRKLYARLLVLDDAKQGFKA